MFSSLICFYLFFLYISFWTFFGQGIALASQRGVKQCNQNMESDILQQHSLALSPWPSKSLQIPHIYQKRLTRCKRFKYQIWTYISKNDKHILTPWLGDSTISFVFRKNFHTHWMVVESRNKEKYKRYLSYNSFTAFISKKLNQQDNVG